MKNEPKLYRIVLTGSPCSGKSTALAHIKDRFSSLGFNVYLVPESATLLILGGISLLHEDSTITAHRQSLLLETQIALEQIFTKAAKESEKDSIIIFDRGTMDSSAFVDSNMWQAILDEHNYTTVGLRDKHYDAVIHLVTAAKGVPFAYTLENNLARSESIEQAIELDQKIQHAWIGHSHLKIIDSYPDFSTKISKVLQTISNIVGVPEPLEIERKFLVTSYDPNFDGIKFQRVEIEQIYLLASKGVARIRKRGQDNSFTYTHTVKYPVRLGTNIEVEKIISGKEYLNLSKQQDPSTSIVKKTRICFLWKNQYFELDIFGQPHQGLMILEAELDNESDNIELPPFIEIKEEVTDKVQYQNNNLAKKSLSWIESE